MNLGTTKHSNMRTYLKISLCLFVLLFLIINIGCKKNPPKVIPTLTTSAVSNVTSNSATSGGSISSDGNSAITVRGVCWSENQNPTISNSKTTDGSGVGNFNSLITGLTPGKLYYLRAYATNTIGTAYGNQISFNASSIIATITTNDISDITNVGSNSGGNIIDDGGSSVIERGVCWNTSPNPTVSDSKFSDGSGLRNFNSCIKGLLAGTEYYVRAYAVNSVGTAYGNEVSFKTLSNDDYLKCEQAYPGVKGEIVSVIVGKDTLILKKVNDDYVYEGDIIFYKEQIATTKGAGSINTIKWPNNIVYFSISSNVKDHQPIENAIKEYENKTNLIFKQRINEKNFIEFKSHNEDFSDSNLGMVDYLLKHNLIRLGTKNYNAGVVMHEIGHSIGLEHEHSKKGRDQYIEVLWENVEDSETARYNLEEKTNTIVTPGFDFNSIMLYWSGSFSKNGGYTLVKRDNKKPFGNQREYLSPDDIKIINLMYPSKPLLSTIEASEITENSVKSGGIIIKDGGYHITKKGVCWSKDVNPDINDNKTSDGTGNESYTSNITGLEPGTAYYIRAYAENASGLGISYGNQITFTTKAYNKPIISTSNVTNISSTTAVVGGNITNDGGAPIIDRGIYYSTNILLNGTKHQIGNGTGPFSSTLSGLTPNTTYYIKAYATNNTGTSYGSTLSFKTDIASQTPTVTTALPTDVSLNAATLGGIVTSAGSSNVTERGIVYSTTQNPTTSNFKVTGGSGIGVFSMNVTGLTADRLYYVRAYAINSQGTGYGSQVSFFTGFEPVAQFVASPLSVNEGESVQFTDQSSYSPTSWSWNFGDGGTSTLQNPSHNYTTSGTYTVSLTATNSHGTNTMTRSNYITVNPAGYSPIAAFIGTPTAITAGESVQFTDQSSNSPTSWSWNFGDGGTSTSQNPSHTYPSAGTYTVSLTATNSFGSDSEIKTNYITSTHVGTTLKIGDSFGGGKVAYILVPGDPGYNANVQHGLIVATVDQSADIQWWNGSFTSTGATGTALGTGSSNTTAIISSQGNIGTYAAKICRDYRGGGFNDWFLPSKDELNKLYLNKEAIGGFSIAYWSSSEYIDYPDMNAWAQFFSNGVQPGNGRQNKLPVRAIRTF